MSGISEMIQRFIDASISCAVECERCAKECLKDDGDDGLPMRCIGLTRQCSAVCRGASELVTIGGEYSSLLFDACARICKACAEECEKYQGEHFEYCARECRACIDECKKIMSLTNDVGVQLEMRLQKKL
jgi:hypothetical protein